MKKGNWVAMDKTLATSFSEIRREYSKIEAMFSLSLDINCRKQRSEASYSRMWGWSRGKVKRFIKAAKKNGQATDRQRTGNGHAYSLLYKDIQNTTDRQRTGNGQATDTKYKEQEQEEEKNGANEVDFNTFWNAFNDKRGKAPAKVAFNKAKKTTPVSEIIKGAKIYTAHRKTILSKGGTPKMAQGWLTDRRWEDETEPVSEWE